MTRAGPKTAQRADIYTPLPRSSFKLRTKGTTVVSQWASSILPIPEDHVTPYYDLSSTERCHVFQWSASILSKLEDSTTPHYDRSSDTVSESRDVVYPSGKNERIILSPHNDGGVQSN